ncbi:hypothetical protein CPB84DRAFT_1792139 [Gymnopilus junonius]|uniref:Uncharacterized protein n=1 Tax=Gymnopilus junonius TaxID=109634 RepID=A0A9P5TIB2_GYMJU|nr:hypothetical protein CPB84DRAFT_1792139 [Gymnopilus junonius]
MSLRIFRLNGETINATSTMRLGVILASAITIALSTLALANPAPEAKLGDHDWVPSCPPPSVPCSSNVGVFCAFTPCPGDPSSLCCP